MQATEKRESAEDFKMVGGGLPSVGGDRVTEVVREGGASVLESGLNLAAGKLGAILPTHRVSYL